MTIDEQTALTEYLCGFISEARRKRFDEVLAQRTGHIRVVLENVYQAHNASAVLRSCDCFGIQHVHFIEDRNALRISDEVAMGSSTWLTVHRHNKGPGSAAEALAELKSRGYRIVATSPHPAPEERRGSAVIEAGIHELPVDQKFALVFGTELDGITSEVSAHADAFVRIPMYGFTESFNISVSAAICMHELTGRMRRTLKNTGLPDDEKREILLQWLISSIEHGEALAKGFLERRAGDEPSL